MDTSLVMEHNKSEVFHFTRSQQPTDPSLDLTSVRGPILTPKPIWQYLGFFFDCKLIFQYYVHHHANKCISTLNAMKLLGNSSCGILPIQKYLLYRTCVLLIALYSFQLWFFKSTPKAKNLAELRKMQCKAALWIIEAFWTSPTERVKAIAGLILINLHLRKLNSRHHLWYALISPSHAINSLLSSQHTKNYPPYRFATLKLTEKQYEKLKSPIKDVNKHLLEITEAFNSIHSIFSSGSRVVNRFSSRITFHSSPSLSDEDLYSHIQRLN